MSGIANAANTAGDSIGTRLRNFAIGSLFAVVLLVPRLLRLRGNKRIWLALRVLLATAGAALVVLPLSFANNLLPGIVGLGMFLAAILLPSAKPGLGLSDKAKELGALIVVNGGEYQAGSLPAAAVRLFVGAENIWVLDAKLQPVLVVPTNQVSSVNAAETRDQWIVRVRWIDRTADFHYRGIFAEHLARVAESTIRGVMHAALPILPQRRAVGA